MGLIGQVMGVIFGNGRNVLRETAEVFRPNAEMTEVRDLARQGAALDQFSAEFTRRRGWFDALIDGLNRMPRPMLALGTIGLMIAAMVDPVWFAQRMQGLALVPEALWWLMGAIVSFYFGARHQAKGQEFQREIAVTMSRVPEVVDNIARLRTLEPKGPAANSDAAPGVPGAAEVGSGRPVGAGPVVRPADPPGSTATSYEADEDDDDLPIQQTGTIDPRVLVPSGNAALDDWRRSRAG